MAENQNYTNDLNEVPVLVEILHNVPHFNTSFHKINNSFRPNDENYRESLSILASIPIIFLLISLLGLLIYLIQQCRHRKFRTTFSILNLKVILSIITLMCCVMIALGLYGNHVLHESFLKIFTTGRNVNTLLTTAYNQSYSLEKILKIHVRPDLVELADIFDQPVSDQSALSKLMLSLHMVQGNNTLLTNAIHEIRRPLIGVNITEILTDTENTELIRWPVTALTLSLILILCFVLLVGVAKHNRCILIFFSIYGLVAIIATWLMSSVYLPFSVAVADHCYNPNEYLFSIVPRYMSSEAFLQYIQCKPDDNNFFTWPLREAHESLNNIHGSMKTLKEISKDLFNSSHVEPKLAAINSELNNSERLLHQLTVLMDCKTLHHNYFDVNRDLCGDGLLGLFLLFITSFIAAVLLTGTVWAASHTWIYIKKHNDYSQVDALQHQQQILIALKALPRDNNGYFRPAKSSNHHENLDEAQIHQDSALLQDSGVEKQH
ncbi:protein tweety-like [Cochliomyia hominivorax]